MKKVFLFIAAGAVLASCGNKGPKTSEEAGDAAKASGEAVVYTVSPEQTTLGWKGNKQRETEHNGTVAVKSGQLSVENGEVKAGSFVIDMKTIAVLDEGGKEKLPTHLKGSDFFHVDSFPEAKFEITKVEKLENAAEGTHKVYGNLTIKGVSREINFPATINVSDATATASAKFEINRNDWGIVWGGEKDANIIDFMKDNMITNMISFDIKLVANK